MFAASRTITMTSGRKGGNGTTTVKKLSSEAAAKAAYDELVLAKTKNQYELVAAKPIVVARYFEVDQKFWEITLDGTKLTTRFGKVGSQGQRQLDELASKAEALAKYNNAIGEKLAKGYVECGAAGAVVVARNPELERAIANDPYDTGSYSVLADWLQDRGDPRGELIALQLANKARPAIDLIDASAAYFLGPLAEHVKCYDGLYYKPAPDAFTWRFGFIHAARMSYNQYWNSEFKGDIAQVLELLLGHPSGRFLTELTMMYNDDPADDDLQQLIDVLAKLAPQTLRRIIIGDDVDQISWYHVGNLSELWHAVPKLDVLEIEAGSFTLGKIELPSLRRAVFKTGSLSTASGKALATASWPRIEHLEIYYGDEMYGGDCSMKQVQPLLDRTDLKSLTELGLMDSMFADELCIALPRAKIVPQLRKLDLSCGMMTDEGARTLATHADAFAHLEVLDVSDNYLSSDGIKAVKRIAKKVITDTQKDDDGDPEMRWVSVGE